MHLLTSLISIPTSNHTTGSQDDSSVFTSHPVCTYFLYLRLTRTCGSRTQSKAGEERERLRRSYDIEERLAEIW